MIPRPDLYRPATAADLIGPAATVADAYLHEFRDNAAHGFTPPFKLLLLGAPGVGKTTTAKLLAEALVGDPMNLEHLNGTDLTIDTVRQIKGRFGMASLFGGYQGVLVDELDRATDKAQVDLLTTLDKLPDGWFFIGTTNHGLEHFEARFQSRFEQVSMAPPSDTEIDTLLTGRFGVPDAIAHQIATCACGNVRQALLDSKTWLTTQAIAA